MFKPKKLALLAAVAAAATVPLTLGAELAIARKMRAPNNAVAAGGVVNLPYTVSDNQGNQYFLYQYGQFQQQGQMPVYSQGAMLQVNGNYPQAANNQAKVDEKTGEVVFENMMVQQIAVTRRILIDKEEGSIRYIDIIKNTGNAEAVVNLNYQTSLNYGIQNSNTVADPKKPGNAIGWVATTHANGRVVAEMWSGKAAKTLPQIQNQPQNNGCTVTHNPKLGAGKEVALMHFHYTCPSTQQGEKFITGMRESKVMSSIPIAVRKLIVNFRGGENFVGDHEILRGDILDVVELRTGDQLKGNLRQAAWKLTSFYGDVEVPADKVIGLLSVGDFRPRQLVVTKDGEVFGGNLAQPNLRLELSSGQVMEVPVNQVSRVGYRKRVNEPEEWTFEKPMVMMRTGDRIGIRPPTAEVSVSTRYGALKLKPEHINSINFQVDEHGVHDVMLNDGSKFAGLVGGELFEMNLAGEGPEQSVKFPASSMRRLQLAKPTEDVAEDQPTLDLLNEDMLVGAIAGDLKLDTAFSTIELTAGEIKRLVKTPGSPSDVQVTLWDETAVSGQLQNPELAIALKCGVRMRVPVALIEEYVNPRPQPSKGVIETIKKLVVDLNADDFKRRDSAQDKLTTMGVVVMNTLKELRPSQTPEAQGRIDLILKNIEATQKPPETNNAPPAPQPGVQIEGVIDG